MANDTMDVLVCYDVSTGSLEGKARLRAVANICKGYGQRVQYSLFECRVDRSQLEGLEAAITAIMNPNSDSLRIYIIRQPREDAVLTYGVDRYTDFDDPLIF